MFRIIVSLSIAACIIIAGCFELKERDRQPILDYARSILKDRYLMIHDKSGTLKMPPSTFAVVYFNTNFDLCSVDYYDSDLASKYPDQHPKGRFISRNGLKINISSIITQSKEEYAEITCGNEEYFVMRVDRRNNFMNGVGIYSLDGIPNSTSWPRITALDTE